MFFFGKIYFFWEDLLYLFLFGRFKWMIMDEEIRSFQNLISWFVKVGDRNLSTKNIFFDCRGWTRKKKIG